ncbi:hypothetical protein IAT38_003523 [Cryptococcus sp. DSM 104549]
MTAFHHSLANSPRLLTKQPLAALNLQAGDDIPVPFPPGLVGALEAYLYELMITGAPGDQLDLVRRTIFNAQSDQYIFENPLPAPPPPPAPAPPPAPLAGPALDAAVKAEVTQQTQPFQTSLNAIQATLATLQTNIATLQTTQQTKEEARTQHDDIVRRLDKTDADVTALRGDVATIRRDIEKLQFGQAYAQTVVDNTARVHARLPLRLVPSPSTGALPPQKYQNNLLDLDGLAALTPHDLTTLGHFYTGRLLNPNADPKYLSHYVFHLLGGPGTTL